MSARNSAKNKAARREQRERHAPVAQALHDIANAGAMVDGLIAITEHRVIDKEAVPEQRIRNRGDVRRYEKALKASKTAKVQTQRWYDEKEGEVVSKQEARDRLVDARIVSFLGQDATEGRTPEKYTGGSDVTFEDYEPSLVDDVIEALS